MKEFNIQNGEGEFIIHLNGDNSKYTVTYDHGQIVFQNAGLKYTIPADMGDYITFLKEDPNTGKRKYLLNNVRDLYRDTTPTDFGLGSNIVEAAIGSSHFTEEIIIGGTNESIPVIAPAGVIIYVNGKAAASGTEVDNGDVVKFEIFANSEFETTDNYTLSVGDITKSFSITTEVGVKASCLEWLNYGRNTSGIYRINPTGNQEFNVYCDMTTDGGGWMLVASWSDAAEWTKNSTSTSIVFDETPKNAFSSNFGNVTLNHVRIHASTDINSGGASADADFYYNYEAGTSWKQVWASAAGNRAGYSSPTPRQALKQFTNAKNIKYNSLVNQTWNNQSDWRPSVASAYGWTADWWQGLTNPGTTLGIYSMSTYADGSATADGSFGLSPSNASYNSGQDESFNIKIGYDDQQKFIRLGGGNTTNTYTQQESGIDKNTSLWLWIR
jgi:hypothetical protein